MPARNRRIQNAADRGRPIGFVAAAVLIAAFSFFQPHTASSQEPAVPSANWSVTIVLPPKVVAGQWATLAVFGADGRLASGVTIDMGNDQRVKTDASGRAAFTAPAQAGVLLARASGASAAALVDPEVAVADPPKISVAPVLSLRDRFSVCGGGFRGDADSNRVRVNDENALILAASPECLVALTGPKATPGPATISAVTAGGKSTVDATIVSLLFDSPQPPPMAEKKSRLSVQVMGSDRPLSIVVENQTPGVLRFVHGDRQELRTSGGVRNLAEVEVQGIRTGDYSFHARLVSAPDPATAQRFLQAAVPLASRDLQHRVKGLANRLARHPRESERTRRELDEILSITIAGDFRTLLESARAAL